MGLHSAGPSHRAAVGLHPKPAARSLACCQAQIFYTMCPSQGHYKAGHPECPDRVAAIRDALVTHGITQHPRVHFISSLQQYADEQRVLQALQGVHPASYLQRVKSICQDLSEASMVDESTYIAPGSYTACIEAAAHVLSLVDAVLDLNAAAAAGEPGPVGFCLVRPPGHHVLPSRPMGFGLVNLVSAAVQHALTQHGSTVRKVAVFDFDVHHGNGTEEIFYRSPDVLYVSIHQQGLWPYTGKAKQTGSAEGEGFTVNLPVPGDAGDASAKLLFESVVAPAVRRFQPDLLVVSAGYDAHWHDPLASLQYQGRTYHWLCSKAQQLAWELCSGRLLLVLEGGYHLESLGASVADSLSGLLGGSVLDGFDASLLREEPLAKVEQLVSEARRIHGL